MLQRETRYGDRRKFRAGFVGVNGLVFRAVIAIEALHVGHEADDPDVANKQCQTDHALNEVHGHR